MVLVVAATAAEVAGLPAGTDVLITGIGKVAAAVALGTHLARSPRPDLIVNLGTAGALRPGLSGVHPVRAVAQHDFDDDSVVALGFPPAPTPTLADETGLVLLTGDGFISDAARRDGFADPAGRWGADLVDMEGYAVAAVANAHGIPVRLIKSVSDGADDSAWDWPAVVAECARELGIWMQDHYPRESS